jgi:DNA polymerase III sliding clamp (beta) subunit (PCNA family)
MKYTTAPSRLLKALQGTAALSPETGKRFQIESTLLSVKEDGSLELQATDTADAFWFRVPPEEGKSFVPGQLFVNSTNLLRVVKEAGKNEVTIEQTTRYGAQISWGKTVIKLPTEAVEDAPAIKRVDRTAPFVSMTADDFMGLLKRVNFATSGDFKNRAMSFVRVEVKPKGLRLSATDGVRIGTVEVDLDKEPSYTALCYVPPIKPARVKLLVDGDGSAVLRVGITQDTVTLSTDSAEMTVRAGAASWPDFDIDKNVVNPKAVNVPTADLKRILGGAEVLKVRGETTCEFKWSSAGMEMEAAATVEGSVNATLPVAWTHEPFSIKFDPNLLWDAVNACDAETVELSFDTHQRPVKLREAVGNRLYLYALGARH